MEREPQPNRLSRIVTDWDGVRGFPESGLPEKELSTARSQVLMRYTGCVRAYILGATKDTEVAEDLSQEFALRFVRGDYSNADPSKGRFRDYLKTSIRNLVTDHFRRRTPAALTTTAADRIEDENSVYELEKLEAEFQRNWRRRLLSLVWDALAEFEAEKKNWFHTVLQHRAKNSAASSTEMAEDLSKLVGKQVTSEWVRQKIHRSRVKFAELLISEVRQSMNTKDEDEILQELAELGLTKYL